MRKLESLVFKNVRCFAGRYEIPLLPLTFLVGDNSSGKSTFLALYRIAWDLAYSRGYRRIDFNEPPFLLGGYDQIANYRGGRAGRAASFEVGLRFPRSQSQQKVLFGADETLNKELTVKFEQSGSHPVIAEERMQLGKVALTISRPTSDARPTFTLVYEGETYELKANDADSPLRFLDRDRPSDPSLLRYYFAQSPKDLSSDQAKLVPPPIALQALEELLRTRHQPAGARPSASAPVRTRPERVYTPISDSPVPEGGHVPMVLARMFFEDKPRWEKLKETLDEFGKGAGLFRSIEIKTLGRHEGDPFQLRFKLDGPSTNVLDMGYGVSQILPILVDVLLSNGGKSHLLQQPEVHLHPKGQAELGTFVATLASKGRHNFLIETHSDYIIDRVRMDVRDGKGVNADDVQILFFDRSSGEVKIHPIKLDRRGDLIDPPLTYRKFFLEEENRFLLGSN